MTERKNQMVLLGAMKDPGNLARKPELTFFIGADINLQLLMCLIFLLIRKCSLSLSEY